MTNTQFEQHAQDLFDYALSLGKRKGFEYAHMDTQEDDRFKNFRVAAEVAQLNNPGQSIINYLVKSLQSLGRYVASDCEASMNESPADRFADMINYTLLLYGWVVERTDDGSLLEPAELIDQPELDFRKITDEDEEFRVQYLMSELKSFSMEEIDQMMADMITACRRIEESRLPVDDECAERCQVLAEGV